MEIVEALPLKSRPYRYRATIRWGERASPLILCDCKGGHNSKEAAMACKKAIKEISEYLRLGEIASEEKTKEEELEEERLYPQGSRNTPPLTLQGYRTT